MLPITPSSHWPPSPALGFWSTRLWASQCAPRIVASEFQVYGSRQRFFPCSHATDSESSQPGTAWSCCDHEALRFADQTSCWVKSSALVPSHHRQPTTEVRAASYSTLTGFAISECSPVSPDLRTSASCFSFWAALAQYRSGGRRVDCYPPAISRQITWLWSLSILYPSTSASILPIHTCASAPQSTSPSQRISCQTCQAPSEDSYSWSSQSLPLIYSIRCVSPFLSSCSARSEGSLSDC